MIALLVKHLLPLTTLVAAVGLGVYLYFAGIYKCQQDAELAMLEAQLDATHHVNELTYKYTARITELRSKNSRLEKEIREYVPDDPNCDLGPDAIGLLDAKRGVPKAATMDAHADAAPSTHLSQPAATEQWVRDAEQYQICRERLNALIEWHNVK